jgi:hypothetical protein
LFLSAPGNPYPQAKGEDITPSKSDMISGQSLRQQESHRVWEDRKSFQPRHRREYARRDSPAGDADQITLMMACAPP